jgi:hypothetical protein
MPAAPLRSEWRPRSEVKRPGAPRACLPGSKAAVASLTADHLEGDIDAAACRTRVGTDFLMCVAHEHGEIGLCNALTLDAHLHREPKTAFLAHANRCRACCLGRRGVFLFLLGDEIERAAEAGRIACGEQVLGGPVPGLPGPLGGINGIAKVLASHLI